MHETSERLSKSQPYIECGHYQGEAFLREAISNAYRERGVTIALDEIFVNDGAKSDIGNIQSIFGPNDVVAVQDPTYAEYVDTNVMAGRAEAHNTVTCQYSGIAYIWADARPYGERRMSIGNSILEEDLRPTRHGSGFALVVSGSRQRRYRPRDEPRPTSPRIGDASGIAIDGLERIGGAKRLPFTIPLAPVRNCSKVRSSPLQYKR